MSQNQLYPFERNRYYAGKMLTSADFQAEQDYFNNKEQFMNTLVYGSGIVCGLGVFSLDDISILVESGVAIDPKGRQIVLDRSEVSKLSAVDGFRDLESDDVTVCLAYRETPIHSVFVVEKDHSGKEHEFSRLSEGYRIFVRDTDSLEQPYVTENEFLTGDVIYRDEDFKVEMLIPATVSRGRDVRALIRATKLSSEDRKLTLSATIQTPGMLYNGRQEFEISLEDLEMKEGETYEVPYWLSVLKNTSEDTRLLIKSESTFACVNDEAARVSSDFAVKLMISDALPVELVNRGVSNVSLEMRELGGTEDFITLARLKLIRTASTYVIDQVIEYGVRHYVTTPATEQDRKKYMEYFTPSGSTDGGDRKKAVQAIAAVAEQPPQTGPQVATGIVEIPLGDNPKRGNVFYSGEIMHGLGAGNVYVELGFESVSADEHLGVNAKSTIYGDSSLFSQDILRVPAVDMGVKVLNEKGSFVVGVRLRENLDFMLLTYRWVAIRFPQGKEMPGTKDLAGKTIVPETPTVVLDPRESHYFGVRFQNMDPCSITYELSEENSGEITSDGIYTAPSREGVYEICISCTDMPFICAYAYAIVKRREKSEADDLPEKLGVKTDAIPGAKAVLN